MFAIVGLGNPGDRYSHTRHNAGFWVLEVLKKRLLPESSWKTVSWKTKGGSAFLRSRVGQDDVVLVRPERYMNLSGEAAQPILTFFKVEPSEIIVIHDDLDVDPGGVRVKFGGGDGGHRGIADLVRALGTPGFFRVRVGIGRPIGAEPQAARPSGFLEPGVMTGWVLGVPRGAELEAFEKAIVRGADAAESLVSRGLEVTQREFNRKNHAADC